MTLTPEQEKARTFQLAFREQLRQLCLDRYAAAQKADLPSAGAAGIIAEECMHMAAFFVTRGSAWDADAFARECHKLFEYHKDIAIKEQGKPN